MSALRKTSFGQQQDQLSFVDRFGVWLSRRSIQRFVPHFQGLRFADYGCGYHAPFFQSIQGQVHSAVLMDVALAESLKKLSHVRAFEGDLIENLSLVSDSSLDVILFISVLEHLFQPEKVLSDLYRQLAPGGLCLINVPSWRGQYFLEFSAFRLGLSPAAEMDDHKMYYDPRDLWPLLVKAGFKPSQLKIFTHKFGLNTFAVCRK